MSGFNQFDDVRGTAEFTEELRIAINRNSIDTTMNVPDFVLAEYLVAHLRTLREMGVKTAEWGDI